MERISLHHEEAAARAADVLKRGGVILYPTDTLYGLGADALSDEAVAKVYEIKGREEGKPTHCIVADLIMAERYAEVNDLARALAKEFLPGPLTLILKKREGIDTGIAKNFETFGIRIPDNPFCLALANLFGEPYTTPSANLAGLVPERSPQAILHQLGANESLISLVVDGSELPPRPSSTVVDASSGDLVILREGAIPASKIRDFLGYQQ
ncbi:MAG TPA: L-threonylcarbamoyladenylate synthase [Candidatus Paceibacterota bacterium]|nr:L-threonylcarbamoyladenylate synthase [Candidatus Paceibacterota bacterium]